MNKYINQCIHNEEFLSKLCSEFPESYFDWKVTVILYCSIHLIRGWAYTKGEVLGNRHTDVFNFIERETSKKSKIFKAFDIVYRNSRNSRYAGFTTRNNFERFCAIKYNESKTCMGKIKSFVESQGLEIAMIEEH